MESSNDVHTAGLSFTMRESSLSSGKAIQWSWTLRTVLNKVMCLQGTTSGRLDTYYGAGRLGGAPGHLIKTLVPNPEDAAASVAIRPVREASSSSQASQSQSPGSGHSGHSNSSASSSGMFCPAFTTWTFPQPNDKVERVDSLTVGHAGSSFHSSPSSTQQQQKQQKQQQGQAPRVSEEQLPPQEHLHSSACGPLQHSDSGAQNRGFGQPSQRLQHAWSAPGALQDNLMGFVPSTPPRLQQGHQQSVQAWVPGSPLGSFQGTERGFQRYPALQQSNMGSRPHPVSMQTEVGYMISTFMSVLIFEIQVQAMENLRTWEALCCATRWTETF